MFYYRHSHYFEDADSMNVTNMFGNIQADSSQDRGNAILLNLMISCLEMDSCPGSLAVTDSDPVTDGFTPTIRLCPLFFTNPATLAVSQRNVIQVAGTTAGANRISHFTSWKLLSTPFYMRSLISINLGVSRLFELQGVLDCY